jgi:hypothetical protein
MDAVTNNQLIKEYATTVDALGGFDLADFTDAFYALIQRDDLFSLWKTLSQSEKEQVQAIDNVLKSKKEFANKVLPAKSSTPQAKAEGRWWWFLNEA